MKRGEQRKVRRRNDPAYRARERDQKRRDRYGLTQEALESLYARAGDRCELCGKQTEWLNIDHDHVTGRVRGLLCSGCNTTLHWVERSDGWLDKATEYLRA